MPPLFGLQSKALNPEGDRERYYSFNSYAIRWSGRHDGFVI